MAILRLLFIFSICTLVVKAQMMSDESDVYSMSNFEFITSGYDDGSQQLSTAIQMLSIQSISSASVTTFVYTNNLRSSQQFAPSSISVPPSDVGSLTSSVSTYDLTASQSVVPTSTTGSNTSATAGTSVSAPFSASISASVGPSASVTRSASASAGSSTIANPTASSSISASPTASSSISVSPTASSRTIANPTASSSISASPTASRAIDYTPTSSFDDSGESDAETIIIINPTTATSSKSASPSAATSVAVSASASKSSTAASSMVAQPSSTSTPFSSSVAPTPTPTTLAPTPPSASPSTPTPTPTPDSGSLRPFSTKNMVPLGYACQPMTVPQTVGLPFYGNLYYTAYICGNGMITFSTNSWINYRFPKPFGSPGSLRSLSVAAPFWSLVSLQQPVNSGTFYEPLSDSLLATYSNDVRTALNIQQFAATWGFQVTWYRLIANETALTSPTNTFQCQLITDGTNSYVLYRYPKNSLQWSLPQENTYLNSLGIGSPVAGYNNGPSFFNIRQSATGGINTVVTGIGNTGKRGFWIYSLSSNVERPPEGSCRNFLTQPAPTSLQAISRCPCSLGQAILDRRFIFDSANSATQLCYYSRYIVNNFVQKCCYQNFSPGFGSYLSGISSPGAGYIVGYTNNAYDNTGYGFCCHPATPQSLCVTFYNNYPSRECQISPRLTWSFGDPHFTTLDGVRYTFNGLGDFVLLQNRTAVVPALEVQARCVKVAPNAGATAFRAVGASEGNSGSIEFNVNTATNTIDILYNKQTVVIGSSGSTTYQSGLIVNKLNTTYAIAQFPSGTVVIAKVRNDSFMDISMQLSVNYFDQTQGLLGRWDNNANNDFTDQRTGVSFLISAVSESQIHNIAETWAVDPLKRLIANDPPSNSSYVPIFPANITFSSQQLENDAASVCQGNQACLYDVALTDSLSIGSASAAVDQQNTVDKQSLVNRCHIANQKSTGNKCGNIQCNRTNYFSKDHRPPQIVTPKSTINATIGEKIVFQVSADSAQQYTMTYTISGKLPADYSFPNGSADGTFVWNVTSADPISITFVATDSQGRSSAITPKISICNCSSNGQCMWNAAIGSTFALVPCTCNAGYTGLQCESDINACALNGEACFPGVTCTDQPAPAGIDGFTCGSCPSGTAGDGKVCSDIQECSGSTHGCNQVCVEIFGSYRCQCNPGYRLSNDSKTCTDINECLEQNACSQRCVNTAGSYTCGCRSGFTLLQDGRTCASNNPCQTNNICGIHACSIINGQEVCECNNGYALNSAKECADINECATNNGNCQQVCINTIGSYQCSCNSGQELRPDGKSCVDLNECNLHTHDCDSTQLCQNTPTYYYCICRPGFTFINGRCQIAPQNYKPPVTPIPGVLQNMSSVQATFRYSAAPSWSLDTRTRFRAAVAAVATRYCQANLQICNLTSSVKFQQNNVQFLTGFPVAMGNNEVAAFYVNMPNSQNTLPRPALLYVVEANNRHLPAAVGADALIAVSTFIPTPTPPTPRPTTRPTTPTMSATTQPTSRPTIKATSQATTPPVTLATPQNNDALIIGLTIGCGSGFILILFAVVGFCCRNTKNKPKLYEEREHELKKLNNF
ncbi:Mucin-like protein [Trichoplax sp. H2]|nr:Mucin-like protein [Trichoplax sp. H2]|eukprot:RDD39379.1 Mucin-like protein [Trichoplax sp. H2]